MYILSEAYCIPPQLASSFSATYLIKGFAIDIFRTVIIKETLRHLIRTPDKKAF